MSRLHPSHPRAPLGVLHMADEVGTALAGWAWRGGRDPEGSSALPLAGRAALASRFLFLGHYLAYIYSSGI